MRILYVDTDDVWRGGQEQLFSLMAGMKRRGHSASLAAPFNSPLAEKARQLGIPTYAFHQEYELSPRAFWLMMRILARCQPSIIHFNTPRAMLCGGLAAHLCGIRVRVSSRRVNFPLRSRLSRFKYNRLQNAILTVSVSIRQTLIKCGVRPELVTVIYEGVDLEWIDRLPPSGLSLDRHGLTVGTVAHLSPEKGHATLLEAAACLASRFPETCYVLVGEGPLQNELMAKAASLELGSRVVFTGFRQDSEGLTKRFDVFCLPSLSEGLSSAILAAMANRLPVVATQVGGIPELVVDGETGFLVPPGSPQKLAAALAQLLASSELRRQMGEAGRRRVEMNFTLSRKLDETERVYVRLLQGGRIE